MVNEQTPYFTVLARCQSDRWPLRPVLRTLQAPEHQFSLKALVARTAFLCTASFPTHPHHFTNLVCHSCFSLCLLVYQPIPIHSGGAHSFTAFSRSHWPFWCGTVGSDPTLSLSRVGLAPPLSFSLYLSCVCGPCAPLLTWALLPHPCFAQAGAASLSPGRSLARDTPRMPQKPLVSVSVSLEFLSLYICVMGVN